jgi:leader peptidase (prepilin peptidase)/N-methyltransferase
LARLLLLLAHVPAQEFYQVLFATIAFVLGASIGSFLNVCIYRMPLDISVRSPRRSFCPHCKYQIPWHANIPLITWVVQRGKCRNCGAPISVRYLLVELVTGLLFLGVWWKAAHARGVPWPGTWALAFPLMTLVSLLVVATFIDFEHFIIPDEITWGGAVAGIVFSLGLPALHGEASHMRGMLMALLGAGTGFALLWAVSVLGKLAFGKKTLQWEEPRAFTWTLEDERAKLTVGDDEMWWDELFSTEKDVLVMDCVRLEFLGHVRENFELRTHYEELDLDGERYDLNKVQSFSGTVRRISFNRDAMGFGDVKFMACIGAFLGWKAVFFTVMSASVIGALVGGFTILVGRREWSARIPFGPYLSLGALIWIFAGIELLSWWLAMAAGPLL